MQDKVVLSAKIKALECLVMGDAVSERRCAVVDYCPSQPQSIVRVPEACRRPATLWHRLRSGVPPGLLGSEKSRKMNLERAFALTCRTERSEMAEPSEPARPKMKLKVQKVAAKPSSSSAAVHSVIIGSTDTDVAERPIGSLRGAIELHDKHCSNRGVKQANGRCCDELASAADGTVSLVRKPFGAEPCALKLAVGPGAVELGFVPLSIARYLSPLIDSTELRTGITCHIDTAASTPAFTLHLKASPATVRRGIAQSSSVRAQWEELAKALGRTSAEDLLKN